MRDLKGYVHDGGSGWLRDMVILAIVLGIPFFQFLGGLPLIDPDEGRYAEIPREMLEQGDFVTPTLNYVKYFEKPPLLYWLNAASFKLSGLTEHAARFPSALCGLLTILATYIIARRLYGRRTALIAALILGTSAGFVLQSRIILTDMLLTFCLTAALGAFIIASQREGRRSTPLPWYVFYLFCALAVLAKGLIGIVFPAGIIFFYLLLGGRWKLLGEMRIVTGLALLLAIAAPWFVAVSLKNPEFARFFFIHEHFERFTSTVHGRYQPFWFFLPVLAATMLPWSFFIPGALRRAWRDRHHDDYQAGLYLLIWAVLIFLFFSKSDSKLVPYILPIFPPLAILIANRIDGALDGHGRELKLASLLLGMTLIILGVMGLAYARLPELADLLAEAMPRLSDPLHQFINNAPPISAAAATAVAALFLIQGITTMVSAGRNPLRMVVALCFCSFLLEIFIPRLIMVPIAQAESPRSLALQARSLAGPHTRIVTFGPQQAVSWYTQRRIIVTGKLDELEFGSKLGDQSAWFPDQQALLRMWAGDTPMLIILKKGELDHLLPLLHPAPRMVGESSRRRLISNR
ncbi:phospholipid carrier-dependent glycosyltransferase [Geobacter sp. AOG2]|uniref:phospholipid carrier-dependent glycosyltransferase n=1 Tax=Geobacter sp. AOG2 TaxID=1566347 RepID=UPI001CC60927|nr:phospholipid carrier-dependent glycosyltransferase [Geobacter sp. AOG2]GFE59729.1 glycosyl transferase [Geobacter sp. AOG2]